MNETKILTSASRRERERERYLTSNFYSILYYYNFEIWLSNGLNVRQKQQLLSTSAIALRMLNNASDLRTSFRQLHINEKRALPMDFAKYRLAIQLNLQWKRYE